MPGPLIRYKPLDAALIASKFPGPLQKPGGFAIQMLMDAVGADDPMAGAYPPLVSIYKTAAGVPSRALREAGMKAYQASAEKLGPVISRAAQVFASKWPRVAAHTRLRVNPDLTPMVRAKTNTPVGVVTEPVEVEFSELGRALAGREPKEAAELISHEGAHVAQSLGNRMTRRLYGLAQQLVGREQNPLEASAMMRGFGERLGTAVGHGGDTRAFLHPNLSAPVYRHSSPGHRVSLEPNAMRLLEQMSIEFGDEPAAIEMRNILRARLGREPQLFQNFTSRMFKPVPLHLRHPLRIKKGGL